MEDKTPQQNALTQSLTVFLVLLGLVVLCFVSIQFSPGEAIGVAFIAAVLACVFVAKNVYDSAAYEAAHVSFQKSVSEHLTFSAKELYTELYQKSPVPYVLIDVTGAIKSANLAALRLLGVKRGSEIGVLVFPYLQTEEPLHLEMLIRKFQNRVPVSNETVQIVGGAKLAWALLSLAPFVSNGQQLGLLTLVDITRQKQVENAKTEFVSLASHQLRTPLAGIRWSAELLQHDAKETLTKQQQSYIDRLLLGTQRMSVLVDDFLRVSRFELGTFVPEYTELSFKGILEEVLGELNERITQKQLVVDTFYSGARTTFKSDANLLRMIVTNLLSNAVKYTPTAGQIHVGIVTTNDELKFSVADNGMGIPEAEYDRMFEKLFRASNAVQSVPDGTGLGLYIVKEAVAVLHGKVTFTSVEGRGTTFEVVIPLERVS